MSPPALPRPGPALLLRALLHRPGRGAMPALQHRLAALDLAHVQCFRAALGFAGPGLPLSYAYLLAQRAQLAAMLAPGFAHRIAGLVHVSNRLQRQAPLDPTQPLDLETQVRDEPERADGARFVTLDVALRQQGQVVLSCHSRYLARRRRAGERAPTPEPEATMPERVAWTLPLHAGRHYAALSGDWNPIHLWGWSARLFGLRQPIIHGAHSMARARPNWSAWAAGRCRRWRWTSCGPCRWAARWPCMRTRPRGASNCAWPAGARWPAPGTTEGRTRYRAG